MTSMCRQFGARLLSALALLASLSTLSCAATDKETITPLLFAVPTAPIPFLGSDGRVHLVYELQITNFSSGEAVLETVEVIGDGKLLTTLDRTATAARLQPAGRREASGALMSSQQGQLFLHIALAADVTVPRRLTHRVSARLAAAPPSLRDLS